jgi:alcohol dehydrogenase
MDMCCGHRKETTTLACCFSETGPIEKVVKVEQVTLPPIGEEDIMVEVKCSTISPHDWKLATGQLALSDKKAVKMPYIIGREFSGLVKRCGSKVKDFSRGDRVYGYSPLQKNGCLSQFVIVDQKYACKMDKDLTFEDAATIPYCGLLAYTVLKDIFTIKYNTKVWITNGTGAVGSWAVQIAKDMGAIVIAGTSTENKGALRKLGADQVIDYKLSKTDAFPKDVDYIFDTSGKFTTTDEKGVTTYTFEPWKYIREGGVFVSIVAEASELEGKLKSQNATFRRYDMEATCENLPVLVKLIQESKIRPEIRSTFKFHEIMKGLDISQMGHCDGKIVVTVNEKDVEKARDKTLFSYVERLDKQRQMEQEKAKKEAEKGSKVEGEIKEMVTTKE